MRRRAKWTIGLLIFLSFIPLAGTALVFIAMNGGISSIILNMESRPDLDSPELNRSRAKLEQQILAHFNRAILGGSFIHFNTSTQDTCYDGANNWKHTDGFAHRCTLLVTNFYGFDGDLRNSMLKFEKQLVAAGWHSNIHDMAWALEQYEGAIDRAASPYPYYQGSFELNMCWAERGSSSLFNFRNIRAQRMGWIEENNFYDQRNLVEVNNVFRRVTQEHRYIVAIAIRGHYF
jgi:hypothetical protein